MKTVERPAISQQIAEARDKGDLSENAEYDAAKEAQGMLEAKIAKTEAIFANARIIDESQLDTSKACILSAVPSCSVVSLQSCPRRWQSTGSLRSEQLALYNA